MSGPNLRTTLKPGETIEQLKAANTAELERWTAQQRAAEAAKKAAKKTASRDHSGHSRDATRDSMSAAPAVDHDAQALWWRNAMLVAITVGALLLIAALYSFFTGTFGLRCALLGAFAIAVLGYGMFAERRHHYHLYPPRDQDGKVRALNGGVRKGPSPGAQKVAARMAAPRASKS